ncbi:MAG: hypothetical protein DHS20C18_52020 [Saprospiraceae bacterium]|nr:MAG: hypothetical protein DHS20C18_52020 [Saprospiraceae bacterium]
MKPFIAILLFVFCGIGLQAQRAIDRQPSGYVNDYASLLSRQEVSRLEQKLRAYQQESSTQIAIVTETSLDGDDAFEYSNRLAQQWGIGGGENDNGILIYIAKDDRQIRIQTGYGTEGFLPDALAKRIIDNIITPAFRNGQYYQGIDRAVDTIIQLGDGEYTNENPGGGKRDAKGGVPAIMILFFIIILLVFLSRFGGGDDDDDDDGGYYRGGRYDYDQKRKKRRRGGGWIFFPGGFSGGGGGGFGGLGGGGGFGGFGGGGFGGGGAGGSW